MRHKNAENEHIQKMLFDMYCNDHITLEEFKERISKYPAERKPDEATIKEQTEKEYKEAITRCFALYLDGRISKQDLIDVLSE